MEALGNKLKDLRKRGQLSQAALGKRVGERQSTVANWELRNSIPAKKLPAVASALGVTVSELLGEEPASPTQVTTDRRTIRGHLQARLERLPEKDLPAVGSFLDALER